MGDISGQYPRRRLCMGDISGLYPRRRLWMGDILGVIFKKVFAGLLGTGAQDVHLNFHTVPELSLRLCVCREVSK